MHSHHLDVSVNKGLIPTTIPSSTAALVALRASSILSLISPTSTSEAPPTLIIPTPPVNLASLS
jgi:hypothetical protein